MRTVRTAQNGPLISIAACRAIRITPLVEAPQLAAKIGVARVVVKNETSRFDLPSFKILGASWASYVALRERLGPISDGPIDPGHARCLGSPSELTDTGCRHRRQSRPGGRPGRELVWVARPDLCAQFRDRAASPGHRE